MPTPSEIINEWLDKEAELGSPAPKRIVVSTVDSNNQPCSRIVAFREINEDGVMFVTSKASNKYQQIKDNPKGSMLIWMPLQQSQVRMMGHFEELDDATTDKFWQTTTKQKHMQFTAAFPRSGKVIESTQVLQDEYKRLEQEHKNKEVPKSPYYVGFRFIPDSYVFYSLDKDDGFPDSFGYVKSADGWQRQLLGPS